MPFTVGQRARFVADRNQFGLTVGQDYEVTEVSPSETYIRVAGQTARTRLSVRYFEEMRVEPVVVAAPAPVVEEEVDLSDDFDVNEFEGCCGAQTIYFGTHQLNRRSLESFFRLYGLAGDTKIHFAILNDRQHTYIAQALLREFDFVKLCESRSNHGGVLHTYALHSTPVTPVVENVRQF